MFEWFTRSSGEDPTDGKTVKGYAVLWDNTDYVGTQFRKGVFAKDLKERSGRIRFLWQHNPEVPLGNLTLKEDDKGLWVEGRIEDGPSSDEAKRLVDAGLVDGFSVGFIPTEATELDPEESDGAWLAFDEARLLEVSLVTIPAADDARVEEIRSMQMRVNTFGGNAASSNAEARDSDERLDKIEEDIQRILAALEKDDEEESEEEEEVEDSAEEAEEEGGDEEDEGDGDEEDEEVESSSDEATRSLQCRIKALELERDLVEFDRDFPMETHIEVTEESRAVLFRAWRDDRAGLANARRAKTPKKNNWAPDGGELGSGADQSAEEQLFREAGRIAEETGRDVPSVYRELKWGKNR